MQRNCVFHKLTIFDKNKWCKENNIPLIRIQYFDEDKITDEYIMEVIKNER